jgi:hypothetical protein
MSRRITRRTALKAGAAAPVALVAARAAAQGARDGLGQILFVNRGPGEARPALGTAGFAAPRGALPAGTGIELRLDGRPVPSQLDRFNAWPDGSLRFGVVSAVLPRLGGGAEATATVVAAAREAEAGPPMTPDAILAYLEQSGGAPRLDWTDRDHGSFAAELATALRASAGWNPTAPALAGRWLSGPLCTEWICSAPLVGERKQHPSLRVWFHCRAWRDRPDGSIVGARVQVVIDNSLGPHRIETRDATGDAVISRGGKPVWQRAGRVLSNVRWDSEEGTAIANARQSTVVAATAFQPDDRYKILEVEGSCVHLLQIKGGAEAVGRIMWHDSMIAYEGRRDSPGPLGLYPYASYQGKIHLQLSRRVRIVATNKEDAARGFEVKGASVSGAPLSERIALGPSGVGVGRQIFATVEAVSVDGPLRGPVNVGTAGLPASRAAPQARLWGMSVAAQTRWPVTIASGNVVLAVPQAATLIQAKVVPHYDPKLRSKEHDGYINKLHAGISAQSDTAGQLVPNGRDPEGPGYSSASIVMGGAQPGGRPDLAVIPGQHVAWLLRGDNRKALEVVLSSGQAFNQWPWHFRDYKTGLCVDPAVYPGLTTHPNARHELKPPHMPNRWNSMCQMSTDPEHWMEFNYLPFLLTGDLAHYETLFQSAFAAWVWHPAAWPDAPSTGYKRAIVTINARAVAWVMRNLGHVRACGPDRLLDAGVTAPREIIDKIYDNQQQRLNAWFVQGPDSNGEYPKDKGFRVPIDGGKPNFGHAPWMQSYLAAALAHLHETGVLNADGGAMFNWFKDYMVELANPASTHPAAAARSYYWRARSREGAPLKTMAEIYKYMADVEWPQPVRESLQHIQPALPIAISGGDRVGQTIEASVQIPAGRRPGGVIGIEFVGRQIYTMADKGLGTILAVDDTGDGRGNRVRIRVEQPFTQSSYGTDKWRLQLPPAGPARYITVDPTHSIGDYPYWMMGALAALANAGVEAAAQRWQELRKAAQNSNADFTDAAAYQCGWAISPRPA